MDSSYFADGQRYVGGDGVKKELEEIEGLNLSISRHCFSRPPSSKPGFNRSPAFKINKSF